MKDKIKEFLFNGNENISLSELEQLASLGETNLVDRKSMKLFEDTKANTEEIKGILSEAVSAFSNYSGGFILLGIDNDGNIEDGIINKHGHGTIKEWLEDIIPICCSPAVRDFSIKVCNRNEKCLFVIVVGESIFAPHQANYGKHKNKYYSRIDGKSKPIDGIMVRDIFNRQQTPDFDVEFSFSDLLHDGKQPMNYILHNTSSVCAEKVICIIEFGHKIFQGLVTDRRDLKFGATKIESITELIYPGIGTKISDRNMNAITLPEFFCNITIAAKNMFKKEMAFVFKMENNQVVVTQKFSHHIQLVKK